MNAPRPDKPSNRRIVLPLVMIVAGMTGMAWASVPLYRLFCQVTGFGGTTQRAEVAPAETAERRMTVRFDATVADVPWTFQPLQRSVEVQIGETALVAYQAHNRSTTDITGMATFNVSPAKAGPYFDKLACFCFNEQTLKAGETVDMPVSFFVDPAILKDRNLDDVKTITLSYTFFRAKNQAVDRVATAPQPATRR